MEGYFADVYLEHETGFIPVARLPRDEKAAPGDRIQIVFRLEPLALEVIEVNPSSIDHTRDTHASAYFPHRPPPVIAMRTASIETHRGKLITEALCTVTR